jgi:glycosyltransferase involved in cell wall biosynthesis
MRILYFTQSGPLLTGSGTYRDLVLNEMSKRYTIKIFSSPKDYEQNWDIAHILDLKHITLKDLKKLHCPIIVDIHDYYWTEFYPFPCPDLPLRYVLQKIRKREYTKILKQAQGVIVHSEYVKKKICHPNIFLIRYAIDLDGYQSSLGKKDKDLILFVGRDYFRKGIFTLIKALPLVLKKIPGAKVVVIGPEFPHSRMVAKILSRKLPIKYINGLSPKETRQYFFQAALLVLPSAIEAFGIVLLEAMATGLPIVATSVGGIPEVIYHGINGFLVDKGDTQQLAASIISALTNGKKEKRNSLLSHPYFERFFNPQDLINELEEVYQTIRSGNIIVGTDKDISYIAKYPYS